MDTQDINAPEGRSDPKPLDPLRRVFIPIERRTANGTLVFKTTDGELYARLSDGSIRRAHPKVKGKARAHSRIARNS